MEKDIRLDLANETGRSFGDIKPDFATKMARRIRRKFAIKVRPEEITGLALHYKGMSAYGSSIFKDYLEPVKGMYAESSDVDFEMFVAGTAQKFPNEDVDILRELCGWVIYYEYLR